MTARPIHQLPAPRATTRWRVSAGRRLRCASKLAYAIVDTSHPLLAQIVPIRRCNLSCAYCNEYDKTSRPVPLESVIERIDHLARLKTSAVAFSGGEPMLHPELDTLVRYVRARGMLAGLITNGYRLSPSRIIALNAAGLDFIQISVDNVEPDEVSRKSLRLLDRKLRWLRRYATFEVTINSVLGAGIRNPNDAWVVASRARELGFASSVGIIHDGQGTVKPLNPDERSVYERIARQRSSRTIFKNLYSGVRRFQENLVNGQPNSWSCRAGARYLYVDENGVVHYCSQQRGRPARPLTSYARQDIEHEFLTRKPCAEYCTVGCVHRVSALDAWRKPQKATSQ